MSAKIRFILTSLHSCHRRLLQPPFVSRAFHLSPSSRTQQNATDSSNAKGYDKAKPHGVVSSRYFDAHKKSKETYLRAIEMFKESTVNRRGYVEFIQAALAELETFDVHRDLDVYKALLSLFPVGPLVAKNMIQVELQHMARQQDCAIDLLKAMEINGVIPDIAVRTMIVSIFGENTHPHRRLGRMYYWMPKLSSSSPWQLPFRLPDDPLQLSQLAISRVATVDPRSQVTTYLECDLPEEAQDRTWIVQSQSLQQQQLLNSHPIDQPLFLEGAFRLWLRERCVNYFVLRAEPAQEDCVPAYEFDQDDLTHMENWIWQARVNYGSECDDSGGRHDGTDSGGSTALTEYSSKRSPLLSRTFSNYRPGWFLRDTRPTSPYRQHDGVILGVCITGSSSRDSLLSWIRLMQRQCPRLEKLAVVLPMKSPLGDVVPLHHHQDHSSEHDHSPAEEFLDSSASSAELPEREDERRAQLEGEKR